MDDEGISGSVSSQRFSQKVHGWAAVVVSNLNEMARKMSKLSGEIVRNDTADLGGEPVEEEEGGFCNVTFLSASQLGTRSRHIPARGCTRKEARSLGGVVIGFEQIQ